MHTEKSKDTSCQTYGSRFEALQSRFKRNVYGTTKGLLRLDLLKEDFQEFIEPQLKGRSLVLDVGCGEGRLSLPLIQAGHVTTMMDISEEVLGSVKQRCETQKIDITRVNWLAGSLHSLLPGIEKNFDLVIMHAVMEWLDEPWQGLQLVLARVVRGGLFSLAFYNRNSLIYRNLLQGNFRKIKKDNWQQSSTGLTPVNPIAPQQLYPYMEQQGFELITKRGIRCFYDFMRPEVKQSRSYEDVLEMERQYSREEPFLSLGRYIHCLWRRTTD